MQKNISLKNLLDIIKSQKKTNFDTKYYIKEATSNFSETIKLRLTSVKQLEHVI